MKKKGFGKKILAGALAFVMLAGSFATLAPAVSSAAGYRDPISEDDMPLKLRYDSPASHGVGTALENISDCQGSNSPSKITQNVNDDWERWSLPLGNGYFGVNVFGRTDSERLTIADKTLFNQYGSWTNNLGGLNTFSETYIDFGHAESGISDYERTLDLRTALSSVEYTYGGVKYTREYFTSYPDKALVVRLRASEGGKLSFTLRPTIPYEQDKAYDSTFVKDTNNTASKEGTVVSKVTDGVGEIELSGTMGCYGTDFVGLYRVYTADGTVSAGTTTTSHRHSDGSTHEDIDGTIRVEGASDAYIVLTLGTDYELSSEIFTADRANKPTQTTDLAYAREKVNGYLSAITARTEGKTYEAGYEALKDAHLADYQNLFGRVTLNLACSEDDMVKTTDALLAAYKAGEGSTYLEALYFQYGRYLLIASSRKGALPAHLQGAWNRYNYSPWSSGYWHNINVQMNYWPAFSTNLAETFESYVDYNAAYLEQAKKNADALIRQYYPDKNGADGGNGWALHHGAYPYGVNGDRSAGNIGFTTQLFWEYYAYTQDKSALANVVYPVLAEAARYITKVVVKDAEGNYLVEYCDSPEQYKDGAWYYTSGTTYAQTFAYLNNYHTLLAAKEAGIDITDSAVLSEEENKILATVMEQLDHYDPILVGLSGQIKEFREEEYYGDIGEYKHRHISQLVGLYPGDIINSTTPAWLDAAKYSLTERGDEATGWGVAHRLNLRARTKDGNRTYKLLQQLLKNNTATNLWDLHPPFQIDGNFGGTAGISEMLLQSHEGYIEPLAAIPDAWADGSYTGLVARGNFTVGARWADGALNAVDITSGAGGTCRIKADGITSVRVTTASGKSVSAKVSGGILSFETVAGETYLLSGFSKLTKSNPVTSLDAVYTATGPVTLTFGKVNGAVSYNIYKAVGNASDYTFLANTAENAYTDRRATEEMTSRATYAVTAINADGVESERSLAYIIPTDTEAKINRLTACVTESGELQVTVDATTATAKYKLYSKNQSSDAWTLVTESGYPVLFCTYDAAKTYGVSLINYFDGTETAVTTVVDFNSTGDVGYSPSNLLKGKTFVPTAAALATVHAPAYGYATLTDGSMDPKTGRFSTRTAATSLFDATATLDGAYLLSELRLYDFGPSMTACNYAGRDMKIEVSRLGVWTTVWEGTNADMLKLRTKDADGTMCLAFDLGVVEADAIRLSSTAPMPNMSISIYELRLSGIYLEGAASLITKDNIFEGKTFTAGAQATKLQIGNYGKLTDGVYAFVENGKEVAKDYSNRLEVATATPAILDAVMDLGQKTVLNQLRLYDCNTGDSAASEAGTDISVRVCNDGVWSEVKHVTLVGGMGNNIHTTYRQVQGKRDPVKNQWLQFELDGVEAEQIEILITYNNHRIIYYEFECTGATIGIPSAGGERRELFAGKTFTKGKEATAIANGSADYASLTDGVFAKMEDGKEVGGVFNRQVRTENYGAIDAVMDFGTAMIVDELRLYDVYPWSKGASNAGTEIIVRAYRDGAWSEVKRLELTTGSDNYTYVNGELVTSWRGTSGSAADPVKNQWLEINLGGVRAEQIEIVCKGSKVVAFYEFEGYGRPASAEVAGSNTLSGLQEKDLTASVPAHNSGRFPFTNAFDGDLTTRFAVADNLANGYSLEMNLGVARNLYTLRVYDFKGGTVDGAAASRSNDTDVEVYTDGMWIKVVKGATLSPTDAFTSFDLHGVKASRIRIHFNNTQTFDGGTKPSASVYEITCTTGMSSVDKGEMFRAYTSVPAMEEGADGEALAEYTKAMNTFRAMLTDPEADNETIAAYTARMKKYAETADTHAYGAWETVTAGTGHGKSTERRVCKNHPEVSETREVSLVTDNRALATDRLPDGYFAGKTIVTIGDSITYGYQLIDGQHSQIKAYGAWLEDLLGAKVKNLGISGTVITSDTYRTLNNTLTRENVAGADVVTICLGANDWDCSFIKRNDKDYFTLGEYGSTDKTTFYGAVRAWCEKIVEMKKSPENAHTTFVFMTPLISSWSGNVATDWNQEKRNLYGDTLRNYCEAILEVCADYDIPVIDLNLESGFYYNGADDNNVVTLIPDGIHPNAEGQRLLADAVAEGLMNNAHYIAADGTARHTEKKTVVRPTATAGGYTDIFCTVCHAYHRADETPKVDNTIGSAKSVNLSLRGDIGLNLYYEIPDALLAAHPAAAVEFIFADGKTVSVRAKDASRTAEGLYRFTLPLTAMQMSEEVEYHLVCGETSGPYGRMSVRKYCDSIFADEAAEEKNPGITALLRAMLNYGSYAQLYFGYRTDDLAAAGLFQGGDDPVVGATVSVTDAPRVSGSLPGVTVLGYTLALDSETALRLALRGDDIGSYTFTVTAPDGTETTLLPTLRGDAVTLTLANVCASGLSARYTLCVTGGDGKSMTVSLNALCYVGSVLSGTGETEELTNVVRALKLYGDAATAYIRQAENG